MPEQRRETAMTVTIYGTDECKDTLASRVHLDSRGMTYRYVNIDTDEEARQRVEEWNAGAQRTPTIVVQDDVYKRILSVPTNEELDAAFEDNALQNPNQLRGEAA